MPGYIQESPDSIPRIHDDAAAAPGRQLVSMVEQALMKSTQWVVFEPNNANTWGKVRVEVENYLMLKWRNGAFAGAKPSEAFFVKCGLGETMTAADIEEGRLIIEVGMSVARPSEFFIFTLAQTMSPKG